MSDNQGDQGDETISLSDVLVARDSCLPEDELWALCRECCLVLEVVNNSPDQFQTLCVTPDTVAFDQVGNVCFLDLDVDPDPIYLPPEYSNNWNPYKAHLFSLGMTLLYAAEYNVEHTKEKISQELHDLLGRMTADSTTLRPDLESTIILCEEQLCGQSSQEVCCGIAAIAGFGLPQDDYVTVESMYWKGTNLSNFYDVSSSESSGESPTWLSNHYDDVGATGSYATEHDEFSQLESYAQSDQGDTTYCDDIPDITEDVSQAESLPWSEEESLLVTGTFESLDESTITNSESVMENRRRRRVSPQTSSNNWTINDGQQKQSEVGKSREETKKQKPAIPKKPDNLTNSSDHKVTVSENKNKTVGDLVVSELMSESDTDHSRMDSDRNHQTTEPPKNSSSKSNVSEKKDPKTKNKERNGSNSSGKDLTVDKNQNISKPNGNMTTNVDTKGQTETSKSVPKAIQNDNKTGEEVKASTDTTALKNKRNKRKQGLTVADILENLDRNLTEEELWALCKEGTAALQRKKKHLPAYLSPDTLLIRESGNVSFKAIPEEKPLEVIFMAPELQSKGELSEKTCLYGLSVTLRCAAGKKYSAFSLLSVSQDLKELLTFLADSNPAKRPELMDISKICAQHSNGTSSDTICARIFQDAFKALSDREEKPALRHKDEIQQKTVLEQPSVSETSNTGLAKPSAFKPTGGVGGFQPIKPAPFGTNGGGAFCPVPKKLPEVPEPRIPSAFSSPATHFKPIILQQTEKTANEKLGTLKEEEKKPKEKSSDKQRTSSGKGEVNSQKKISPSDNPNDSDKEVVKKLKELKKNLMKHRQPTMAKEIENEDKPAESSKGAQKSSSSKSSLPSSQKTSSKSSEKPDKQGASKGDLESLLKEIQKQGNAPDTQILASAIAQYLKSQMGQESEGQGHTSSSAKLDNPDSSAELDMNITSGQSQLSQSHILPTLSSQLHSQLLGQTMTLPLHQYGGNVITGLPQFQFQQDPVSGLLQLIPVLPLRPLSVHSNSGSGRSNSGMDFTSPIGTSSVVREGPSPCMSPKSIHNHSDVSNTSAISDPTGSKPKGMHGRTAKDLVQKTANLRAKNLGRPSPIQHDSGGTKDSLGLQKWKSDRALNKSDHSFSTEEDQAKHKPGSSLSNKLPSGYVYDDSFVSTQRRNSHQGYVVQHGQFTERINNRSPENRIRTHSNSSSPSPSKDSGVSGMNFVGMKSHPSVDVSLMDRLLNSNMSGKQPKAVGKIVHLLREEFAFDGYMENGVEDLAMAEYIASLGMLKWETFTSAISEKYSDLYWGAGLLANLYKAVNGNRPPSATKLNSRKPPVPRKSSQRPDDDEDSSLSENNENSRERTQNRLLPDEGGTRRPHSSFVPRIDHHHDTSDSSDNEHFEKRRKKKSKHELDRVKSSSSNNLLDGTGTFELVPSLNVPEDNGSIKNMKPFRKNGDNTNGSHNSDNQMLSLPENNALMNRQNSMDSMLNKRNRSSVPNSLSSSFDGRLQNYSTQSRPVHNNQRQMNGLSGHGGSQSNNMTGLSREVSMSSHSSSQSDIARDSDAIPVEKKGHVVYHWAMIQLCMTPEMERFMQDIDEENSQMLQGKLSALDQQLKMERRLRKKTQRYYRNLVDQSKNPLEIGKMEKTTKAERNQMSQVARDITEMTQRIRFIDLCKTHIQMLLAELQGIDVSYLYSIAVCQSEEALQLHPRPDNPLLQFQNLREAQTGCEIQALHAGTPDGLMAYLFASTALSEGFIHQFFFCYRYFTTASEVLDFLINRYISATQAGSTETNISRLQHRVIDLLHFWIEGYFSIDFQGRSPLLAHLQNFIVEHIKEESESGQSLLALLSNCSTGNNLELSSADPEESEMHFWQKEGTKLKWESFKSLVRGKSSAKDKAGKVKISAVVVERGGRRAGSHEILPIMPSSRRNESFMLGDYTSLSLAEQLCLIEQGIFQQTHPVHYLDSKSRGVGVALTMKATRTPAVARRSVFEETNSLFVEPILDSAAIQTMINHSEEVTHWVSAEIVSCSNPKTQVTVLSKFIFIAHTCVELRNFATAMAILDGLENLIIKQLPAWKHLPAKCTSVIDELEATRMFLKNDPLSLMQQGKDCYLYPTIPCAVFFLLHIQQSEIGGFKLANQMYKWGKIRSIAQVIDQIRVFREHIYGFEADHTVQDTLRQRIREMSTQDITTLASQNETNFQKVSSSSGISGAFKKMRGKLK